MAVKDPVCGMEMTPEEAISEAEHQGTTFYFCSEGCRDRFMNEHPFDRPRRRYELVIIGGGPAGLTAAVYAATMKIDTLLVTRDIGGQAVDSTKIKNYMGYDFITGPELTARFRDQLLHSNYVDHLLGEVEVVEEAEEGGFTVTTSALVSFHAACVIVATGMTRRTLGVAGEEKFQRRGVFYGNVQDYSFVAGRDAVVIGGGNSALQLVEDLHTVARRITLLSDFDLTADAGPVEQVRRYRNLTVRENVKVLEISGGEVVEEVSFRARGTDREEREPARGVFIAIGLKPSSGVVSSLVKCNDRGEIEIDADCSTSRPGIFAAGDVSTAFGKRIIIASGEGAKAALAARRHILALRKASPGSAAVPAGGRDSV